MKYVCTIFMCTWLYVSVNVTVYVCMYVCIYACMYVMLSYVMNVMLCYVCMYTLLVLASIIIVDGQRQEGRREREREEY